MEKLRDYRQEISDIDEKMAALFEERMRVSRQIAKYKQDKGLSIRDPKREDTLIEQNAALIKDDAIRSYYIKFLKNIIDISCDFQELEMSGMKIAYGGAEGAFAYIAAKAMYPQAQLISNPDFTNAYKMVESGQCDCAVLPFENSIAGEVGTVMDLMYSGSLFINQTFSLPIRHHLLGLPGAQIENITTVISHPQALGQCSSYINDHGIQTKTAANTSAAARRMLDNGDPSWAAIASEETAALLGLDILDHDIQNDGSNTTRFAAFSRSRNTPANDSHITGNFILMFTVKNEAGALAQALNIIGAHGYNMRSLKSRPMKNLPWSYYFYIEAEGNLNTQNGRDMMQQLSALCAGLKLVGSFDGKVK